MSDDDNDDYSDVSAKLSELAQSFATFPPPGGAERKHNRACVAKPAARKRLVKRDHLGDLA